MRKEELSEIVLANSTEKFLSYLEDELKKENMAKALRHFAYLTNNLGLEMAVNCLRGKITSADISKVSDENMHPVRFSGEIFFKDLDDSLHLVTVYEKKAYLHMLYYHGQQKRPRFAQISLKKAMKHLQVYIDAVAQIHTEYALGNYVGALERKKSIEYFIENAYDVRPLLLRAFEKFKGEYEFAKLQIALAGALPKGRE